MTFVRAVILLMLTLTTACGEAAHILGMGICSDALAELRDDPVEVAERAVAQGDRRLLAVNGYSRWTPGVIDRTVRKQHGYRELEMTSDTPDDASCVDYQEAAIAYAQRYNERVIQLARSAAR